MSNEKIKIYADKLEREIRASKFIKIANIAGYFVLSLVICYLATRDNYLVVGENLYGTAKAGYSSMSDDVVEIRGDGHARLLYERFFSFDYNTYKERKNLALFLGGEALEKLYKNFTEKGFYKNILENNYTIRSILDSTKIENKGNMIVVKCFGRMELRNAAYFEVRKFDLHLEMKENTPIKQKNPYGLSIEKIVIINNEVLTTKKFNEDYSD